MPDSIPATLIAGDTWSWTRELVDYPAPTWTATVYFENAAATFSAAATPSGSVHLFSITAATTAAKPAGRYRWSIRVTNGTEAHTVDFGWVEVVTNPAAAGTHDPRSRARRTLDQLEQCLELFASTTQQSGSINGRSYSRADLPSLIDWRDRLKAEVSTEENRNAPGRGRHINVRFSRA